RRSSWSPHAARSLLPLLVLSWLAGQFYAASALGEPAADLLQAAAQLVLEPAGGRLVEPLGLQTLRRQRLGADRVRLVVRVFVADPTPELARARVAPVPEVRRGGGPARPGA